MKSKPAFGYATFPDEATANRICEELVNENVIACANISGPLRSIYRWEGKINKEQEWVAILKTSEAKKAVLMEKVREKHPYANPCLIFLGVEGGLPDFLNWICKP